MLRYVPNAEESLCFQTSKMKEFEVDFEGKWDAVAKKVDVVSNAVKQEQSQEFHYDCENFVGIAKISES